MHVRILITFVGQLTGNPCIVHSCKAVRLCSLRSPWGQFDFCALECLFLGGSLSWVPLYFLSAQGAIIGINAFFLFRVLTGKDGDSGGTSGSGYASFPEGQESAGGDDQGPAYTPPEY